MVSSGQQDTALPFCSFIKLMNLAKGWRERGSNLHTPEGGCRGKGSLSSRAKGREGKNPTGTTPPDSATLMSLAYACAAPAGCAHSLGPHPLINGPLALQFRRSRHWDRLFQEVTSVQVIKDGLDELRLVLAGPGVGGRGLCWACPGSVGFARCVTGTLLWAGQGVQRGCTIRYRSSCVWSQPALRGPFPVMAHLAALAGTSGSWR